MHTHIVLRYSPRCFVPSKGAFALGANTMPDHLLQMDKFLLYEKLILSYSLMDKLSFQYVWKHSNNYMIYLLSKIVSKTSNREVKVVSH